MGSSRATTDIKVATFDLSKDVLDAIKADKMLFAIDQQQYLQGYLPVFLTSTRLYGLQPGGGQPVLTGPGIVDQDDGPDRWTDLSAQGIR